MTILERMKTQVLMCVWRDLPTSKSIRNISPGALAVLRLSTRAKNRKEANTDASTSSFAELYGSPIGFERTRRIHEDEDKKQELEVQPLNQGATTTQIHYARRLPSQFFNVLFLLD